MMEIFDEAIVESEEGYPFADLSRLRRDAGAFMEHALSEEGEDDMDDEPYRIITPDYPSFGSVVVQQEQPHRPIVIQPIQNPLIQHTRIPESNGTCHRLIRMRHSNLGIFWDSIRFIHSSTAPHHSFWR